MRLEGKVANLIGSWKFLTIQTALIAFYILFNTLAPLELHFDPFPFVFLNVMLSFQAAYTAPIILLSHNRMAERDRDLSDLDRQNTRVILDTIKKLEINLIDAIEDQDEVS